MCWPTLEVNTIRQTGGLLAVHLLMRMPQHHRAACQAMIMDRSDRRPDTWGRIILATANAGSVPPHPAI